MGLPSEDWSGIRSEAWDTGPRGALCLWRQKLCMPWRGVQGAWARQRGKQTAVTDLGQRGHSRSGRWPEWARPFQQRPGLEVWEDQHEHQWVEHSRLRHTVSKGSDDRGENAAEDAVWALGAPQWDRNVLCQGLAGEVWAEPRGCACTTSPACVCPRPWSWCQGGSGDHRARERRVRGGSCRHQTFPMSLTPQGLY